MKLTDAQQQAHDALRQMAMAHSDENPGDEVAADQTASNNDALDAYDPFPSAIAAAEATQKPAAAAPAASAIAPSVNVPPPVDVPPPAKPAAAPPVDLAGPRPAKPSAAPPRDLEMEGLQADAKDRRATSQLGKAVTDYAERPINFLDYAQRLGGGGVSAPAPKSTLWQSYEKEGDRALKDMQERRQSESELAAKSAAAGALAEKQDPQSERAKTYRAVLLKFAPDLSEQLDKATPEQMERIAPWLEKYGDEMSKQKAAKAAPADKAAALEAELKAERDGLKIDYPARSADIDSLASKEAIKNFRLNNEGRLGRDTSIKAAQIAASTNRQEARDVRADVKETKATEEASKQALPGYEHDPAVQVSPTAVDNLRVGHAESKVMSKLIDELDGLVAKNGIKVWPDSDKVKMQADLKQLQLKAKGKAFAELGVLSGPDLAILEDLTGDPTDVMSVFKGGAEGVRSRLGVFKNVLNSGMEEARRSHGYSAGNSAAAESKPEGPPDEIKQAEGADGQQYTLIRRGNVWTKKLAKVN